MTDLLWVGGTTGNWFDPSNWQPPQVPQKGDIARVISLNNSTIVQLSSDPADGVTLEMSEFPHEVQPLLEAQNVTFGPHFTIVGDTAPLDPTPVIAVTGSVVNQGSINSGLEIDGRTGADVFVNQGTLNGPITLGPPPPARFYYTEVWFQ